MGLSYKDKIDCSWESEYIKLKIANSTIVKDNELKLESDPLVPRSSSDTRLAKWYLRQGSWAALSVVLIKNIAGTFLEFKLPASTKGIDWQMELRDELLPLLSQPHDGS